MFKKTTFVSDSGFPKLSVGLLTISPKGILPLFFGVFDPCPIYAKEHGRTFRNIAAFFVTHGRLIWRRHTRICGFEPRVPLGLVCETTLGGDGQIFPPKFADEQIFSPHFFFS